jgi:hypothetical protein
MQCPNPACAFTFRTGAAEWSRLRPPQKVLYFFSYWLVGVIGLMVLGGGILWDEYARFLLAPCVSIVAIAWFVKLVSVRRSLNRAPCPSSPPTLFIPRPLPKQKFVVLIFVMVASAAILAFIRDENLRVLALLASLMVILFLAYVQARRGVK